MNNTQVTCGDIYKNDQSKSPKSYGDEVLIIAAIITVVTIMIGLVAGSIFTTQQMYIIFPMLAAFAVFIVFAYILRFRARANLFGEIGYIYLALALAYTIFPAIKFIMIDFNFPIDFDAINFAILSPTPAELGIHLWRHVLFISGVAVGFLAVRLRKLPLRHLNEKSESRNGRIITIIIVLIGCCGFAEMLLSTSVTTYSEHHIRFDHLSWPLRRLVYLCLIFKSGGYFVLLSLMFSRYHQYRTLIYTLVPIVCGYEIVSSFGSRIVAFTILLAAFGFYQFRVTHISLKKGMLFLVGLAFLFSGIEIIRSYNYSLGDAQYEILDEKKVRASEFEAVYCTGFHLYFERSKEKLPSRNWEMFFYEFISVIPFIEHTTYHPQYWYARNYFPEAPVPPTTMGVIADSAIWGGEFDLFVRSLINGAIFALLTRWFLKRQEKWWALTIYIYCYATCILTLKYSVLFHVTPLVQVILPALLVTEILIRLQRTPACLKSFSTETWPSRISLQSVQSVQKHTKASD
jgi:hypothetical protein